MPECRDCKNCIHYSLCNYEEICHYDIDNIKNAKDCSFFQDHSRFVELPCDIISKAEIKRELSAQCAVKKIDVETAKDMLENLPYIRVNTKQELKERENNA